MMHLKYLLPALFFLNTLLSAGTMYTLSGIDKIYPVVEIGGKKVHQKYKSVIMAQLKETADALGLDTEGYDPRSLALLVNELYIGNSVVIKVRLVIGEEVKRLDSGEKTFALTYEDAVHFTADEDIEEHLEDALDELLARFSEQYGEENRAIAKVAVDDNSFAAAMGYETDYETALMKGKKAQKNIMLVLVSNYCPWCRKFEQRVLLKKEVDAVIQKNYIPLIINKEKDPFPKNLDKAFTPIVHFIDYRTEQSYKSLLGYNSKEEFLHTIKTDSSR